MPNDDLAITPELAAYIRKVTLREPPILRRLREETDPLPNANMQISPEQGQFMALLVHLLGARRTLEVGVFTGYSSLSVALALPDDGRIIACDVSEEWTAIARRYWREAGVERKIDLRLRPGAADAGRPDRARPGAAPSISPSSTPTRRTTPTTIERALVLLRPGGLIAVDNVLWSGRVIDKSVKDADTRAIRAFNENSRPTSACGSACCPSATA